MSKYIPVEPEKWAAMVQDQASLRRYKEICDELDAECSRLKAEVERLTSENESLQAKATNIYNAMVVRCKVEEITHKANADSIISQGMMSEAMKMIEESVAIREQVERLTKAGDALAGKAIRLEYNDYWSEYEKVEDVCIDEVEAWHKAKEGKQS